MENLSSPRNRLLPQKNKIRRQQSVYKSSMYDDIENESTGVSIPNKLSRCDLDANANISNSNILQRKGFSQKKKKSPFKKKLLIKVDLICN